MAGEWLKFESSLPEKPETLAITVAMGWDDPDLTVGKLMRLFRWFDQHTLDGNAASVTPALLDRLIGVTGFVKAVANTGWLVISDAGLTLHNFEYHNGATAKTRAMTAKRVANHRASEPSNASSNAPNVTAPLAREEKRREEKEQYTEAKASGAKAPLIDRSNEPRNPKETVFALGIPLLTAAGVKESNARSFLAMQCKGGRDAEVAEALEACAVEKPIQPIPWLQTRLNPNASKTGKHAGFASKDYRAGVTEDGSFA